ncbi:MAG: FtsQ-type POTRA domain-containing protein [Clostridiales Family XIII bacterium]|jgi:cell division protein FtsQ|nr:FtsQ-type POTRA domain-containing protein [Clostridiales Family XIII bacterium]
MKKRFHDHRAEKQERTDRGGLDRESPDRGNGRSAAQNAKWSNAETRADRADAEYAHADRRDAGRKRKKRRKKHYLLKFLLIVALGVGLYFFITSDLFNVRVIETEGNTHYTNKRIAELSGVRIGTNMFETSMGKAEERLLSDPYIEVAEISRKPFHTIVISVRERTERFIVRNGEKYTVVDYDGMALRETAEPPPLPIVENLKITKAKPGEALVVTENALLADTIRFLRTVEKSDLFFKRILASDIVVKAYVYDGLICKGTYANLEKNIEALKKVILDLRAQNVERGTIIMSGNGTCTFTPAEDA